MTRLTTSIKDALLGDLLKRAFKQRGDEMIARNVDYAHRLYEDALAPHLKLIYSLPKGWLDTEDSIKVQLGAEIKGIRFHGGLSNWSLTEDMRKAGIKFQTDRGDKPFPRLYRSQVVKQYPGDHPLVIEYQKLMDEWNDLHAAIREAGLTARGAMDSVTTVKKLIEVWPEVETLAREYLEEGERKAILPAIPRAQLNTLLDLPPEEQAA